MGQSQTEQPLTFEKRSLARTRKGVHQKRNPAQTAVDLTIQAMLRQGATARAIAAALNVSKSTVDRTKARIKALEGPDGPGEGNPGLVSPQRDAKVCAVIDRFLDAGARMPLKRIKGSDVTTAAKVYTERRWPAKEAAAPVSLSFTNVFIQEARILAAGPSAPTTRGIEPPREIEDVTPGPVFIEQSAADNVR